MIGLLARYNARPKAKRIAEFGKLFCSPSVCCNFSFNAKSICIQHDIFDTIAQYKIESVFNLQPYINSSDHINVWKIHVSSPSWLYKNMQFCMAHNNSYGNTIQQSKHVSYEF